MAASNKKTMIKVEGVSKHFRLPHHKNSSIKSLLIAGLRNKKRRTYENQQVLKNISFEIKEGEFFGIVGRNGSGKSTLLKLLAGIYSPDKGKIQINGSLTPFIELGVGFNPELTGRENVFLNGALLGFSRQEMSAMYDDIVSFAELEKFMDQKLKNYSSGMQVRLAFSIAIQARSDILVLDEVLAVGDAAFQQKCTSVFEDYKARKQTIVLVTHSMDVVEKFCTRALMIEDGEIVAIGSPTKVGNLYSERNRHDYAQQRELEDKERNQDDSLVLEVLEPLTHRKKNRFKVGETMLVKMHWKKYTPKAAGISLMKQSGEYIFGPNTSQDKYVLKEGKNELWFAVRLDVNQGEYYLKAGISSGSEVHAFVDRGPTILIEPDNNKPSYGGLINLAHVWGDKNVEL